MRATDERLLPEYGPDQENAAQMRKDHLIFQRGEGVYYKKMMSQESMIDMLKDQNYIYHRDMFFKKVLEEAIHRNNS